MSTSLKYILTELGTSIPRKVMLSLNSVSKAAKSRKDFYIKEIDKHYSKTVELEVNTNIITLITFKK